MTSDLLLAMPEALAEVWDDLPRLVGPDWAGLYPAVRAAIARLAAADDAGRPAAVVALARLFQPHPRAADALRRAGRADGSRAGGPLTRPEPEGSPTAYRPRGPVRGVDEPPDRAWREVMAQLGDRLLAPPGRAWTQVLASRRLRPGVRGVVNASLAGAPADASSLPVGLGSSRSVEVHLIAPGLHLEGPAVLRIEAGADGRFTMATFVVVGQVPGRVDARVEFWHRDVLLAGVPCPVEVVDVPTGTLAQAGPWLDGAHPVVPTATRPGPTAADDPADAPALADLEPVEVIVGGPYVPPPDLDLRVMVEVRDGRTVLRYFLHSATGAAEHHHEAMGETILTGDPATHRARWLHRLEHAGQDGADEVEDTLRSVGELLYRELLPPALRSALMALDPRARSLQVTSDEPWIPWELVRPFDPGAREPVDEEAWAVRFELSRWLAGPVSPRGAFPVRRLACVAADSPPGLLALPGVVTERDWLTGFAGEHAVADASPPRSTRPVLAAALEDTTIDLWHFAGHGDLDPHRPGEAEFALQDGRSWHPDDLHGRRQAALASARPLVVMNACRTGGQGWSLTRVGGWAEAWVLRSHVGAFLAPQWAVSDAPAVAFAAVLYRELAGGRTLASAVRAARLHVRDTYPGNPTWLAYVLYAHPNGRVTYGAAR